MSETDERYCFVAEWYDSFAQITRKYQVLYYLSDQSIEMFDMKQHKIFLKRSKVDNISLADLYVGSTIHIYSRPLHIVDYGDDYTKRKLSSTKERTLALIKPDAIHKMGHILNVITESGFMLTQLRMCQLGRGEAFQFYQEHQTKPFFDQLLNHITSGPVIAMELMGENAISKWRNILGPTDCAMARTQAPSSIRAKFGKNTTQNACHGSDSPVSASREVEFFFPTNGGQHRNTATFTPTESTCAIVKPHALQSGLTGRIVCAIQEAGFEISAMVMFHIEKANAEEFYEIYKGVVQEYHGMVDELTLGPCIAMEIRAKDAPQAFREMVGPADPEIARHLRPRTLRAQFGKDKIKNAVHCTDLPEDGLLEVEYFFKILDH